MPKLKTTKKSLLLGVFLAVASSVFAGLSIYQEASAWCDNIDLAGAGMFDNVCVSKNYDSLPDSIKKKVSADEYRTLATNCMSGNSNGLDFKIRQGGCADAAASCLAQAVNKQVCTPDVLSSMVGGIFSGQDNGGCNGGRLTSDPTDNCTALARANNAAIEAEKQTAIDAAKLNCTVPASATTEEAKTLARETCTRAIENCSAPGINDNGTLKNSSDYSKYQKCISDGLFGTAKDQSECEGRGGKWIGSTDAAQATRCVPNQNGAQNDGCDGRGGLNLATGKCGDGSVPQQPSPSPRDATYDPTKQCGKVQTILITCDKNGQGLTTLGNVLKIAIQALSVLVGIAAVGGIAWASVLYAKAEDNESEVQKAKELLRNVVIGIILYAFMIAIIGWLVPSSVFG